MKEQDDIVIEIAGIVFAISSDQPLQSISLEKAYRDFLCNKQPEIAIHAHYNGLPRISLQNEDKVFDSGTIWSLYRINGQNVFVLRHPATGPYRVAVFDRDFRQGEVYSRSPEPGEMSGGLLPNPLAYPLSEVLMMCLLAQGRGLMIHACGIDDGGRGYLFAGNSTNGKSTMAGLWREEATILNDDRIVLRQRDGRFWMYGTPWHGDYTGVSPTGVPLEKIFFLRHAAANTSSRKEASAASSMLLTRSFPTLWDKDGMSYTLDFCAQLLVDVPCYELGFVPDGKVVDFVRCVE